MKYDTFALHNQWSRRAHLFRTQCTSDHPSQLTFIRFLIGGIFLLPFAIADIRKRKISIEKGDWFQIILLGIINVAISMNLIQIGYKYTNANLSAIIISANPIFVACLSSVLLKEGVSLKKFLGLFIGISGVLIALNGTGDLSKPGILYGIFLQVVGMLAFSLYTVLGKKTSQKLGSQTMTAFCGNRHLSGITFYEKRNCCDSGKLI
ncbi:MAG: DMT family transporter [Anaerocolumna sp.]